MEKKQGQRKAKQINIGEGKCIAKSQDNDGQRKTERTRTKKTYKRKHDDNSVLQRRIQKYPRKETSARLRKTELKTEKPKDGVRRRRPKNLVAAFNLTLFPTYLPPL
jgi:hypothetical protein